MLIKNLETKASWQQYQHRMAQLTKIPSHPYSTCITIETVKTSEPRKQKTETKVMQDKSSGDKHKNIT